jgi:hypothetical protein
MPIIQETALAFHIRFAGSRPDHLVPDPEPIVGAPFHRFEFECDGHLQLRADAVEDPSGFKLPA